MSNNDDLINDILSELDGKNDIPPAEESAADTREDAVISENEPTRGSASETASENTGTSPEDHIPMQENGYSNSPDMQDPYMQNAPYGMQQEMPVRRAPAKRKKKRRKKRSRLPGVLILTTFIFAVSICLSMVIIAFGKDMLGIGKSDTPRTITINEGVTTDEIAQMLKDEGIIKSPKFFKLFSRLRKTDDAYLPGEYLIRPNMAYETIIKKFTTDERKNKEAIDVTFKEGITLYEAADLLEECEVCKADDFIFYFNSGSYGLEFESRLPTDFSTKFLRMEGYLFPDTYYFYKDMDPNDVCQKIYVNFNKKLSGYINDDASKPKRYQRMEELGLSLDQLITLSSIVQMEAGNVSDMRKIASVFWNRLRDTENFKQLQSDPTSNYSKMLAKHMDVKNQLILDSYDTYIGYGLPPGAISNPGLEAIDAVLDAEDTPYYYFIANIYTAETLYSVTYDEHLEKKAQIDQEIKDYLASQEAQ